MDLPFVMGKHIRCTAGRETMLLCVQRELQQWLCCGSGSYS